ncbi:MAG: tannase/feruloyl esterase family alpha/beta hydrolase [Gammaproteobacteria bacterium]
MPSRRLVDPAATPSALCALAVATLLSSTSGPAHAQVFASAKSALADYSRAGLAPGQTCESMARFKSKDVREIHATSIAATDSTPANCRISGVLAPEIAFEVSLPERWNGRFYMFGNGGLAGEALDDRMRVGQRDAAMHVGFAVAQTNTGHDSRKEPGGSFVLSNPQKAIDYAYRAVNLTAVTAKALTKRYYGKPASRSYWNSCSNGGRQGLIEAQRYPEDFDGILVNSPWVDQTGFTIGAMWNQKAIASARLTAAKLAFVGTAVMAKCDAVDGVKDGLIDDPRKCRFDAKVDVPACSAGADSDACLTAAQSDAVMQVYNGPVSNGKPFFPGFMLGSEGVVAGGPGGGPGVSGWMNWIVPAQPGTNSADFNLAENTMRYLVPTPPRPTYDYLTFDYDRHTGTLDAWGKKANATNTDLSRFRGKGGKLLMTYGWADTVLQPMMGVTYYEQAVVRNGPGTPDFFRLFMVPGMGHCGGGYGTDRFDSMTALVDWVEKGKAPDFMRATRAVNDREARSRPICPYPQVARYSGHGSVDDASNFGCASP